MKGIHARACSHNPSLRLLACHQHPTCKVRTPCSLRRQGPYILHLPIVSGLKAILNYCFVKPPMTTLVTNDAFFPTQLKLILRIRCQTLISCCLLKYSWVLNWYSWHSPFNILLLNQFLRSPLPGFFAPNLSQRLRSFWSAPRITGLRCSRSTYCQKV